MTNKLLNYIYKMNLPKGFISKIKKEQKNLTIENLEFYANKYLNKKELSFFIKEMNKFNISIKKISFSNNFLLFDKEKTNSSSTSEIFFNENQNKKNTNTKKTKINNKQKQNKSVHKEIKNIPNLSPNF